VHELFLIYEVRVKPSHIEWHPAGFPVRAGDAQPSYPWQLASEPSPPLVGRDVIDTIQL